MNTSARRSPRPFLPEDLAAPPGNRFRAGRYIERAAFASALQCVDRGRASIEQTIRATYGDDPVTRLVVNRASVSPASTTTPAWAGNLATQATGDFVGSLAQSAASKLIEAGLRVSLTGVNTLALPRRSALPSALDSAWTVEGAPHPVAQFVLATAVLGPMRKLTLSVALTQEAVVIGGEDVVRTMLRESAAYTLDATMFSTAAATAA